MGADKRPFAAFDIDGTLIRWQLYHAVVDALIRAGHITAGKAAVIKNARMDWKMRRPGSSFKSYEAELIRAYEDVLVRITPEQLERSIDAVFNEYRDQTYVYTRNLITNLKRKNYLLFAISGSQTEIVAKVADYYGFDAFVGTDYEVIENKFTGKNVFHAKNKDVVLKRLIKRFDASRKGSYAIGDSLSDGKMLAMVDNAIAFNPEKSLFELARQNGWPVVLERKNVVYELEADGSTYLLAAAD